MLTPLVFGSGTTKRIADRWRPDLAGGHTQGQGMTADKELDIVQLVLAACQAE
ncbi:hypothetical protein [Undibacterium sp. Ren11W]|uniref:hypothetical protein n=1 Tax=Undibacterium sp. Ren11W TaxID=3413045 RepID=UPI003BF35425